MNTKSKATLYLSWVSGEFEPDLSCLSDKIHVL